MDCSLPGSSVHGIYQARILECVANSSCKESSWLRERTCVFYTAGGLFTTELPEKPLLIYVYGMCFLWSNEIPYFSKLHPRSLHIVPFKFMYFSKMILSSEYSLCFLFVCLFVLKMGSLYFRYQVKQKRSLFFIYFLRARFSRLLLLFHNVNH